MLALGLAGFWLYGKLFPSDEKIIRTTMARVAVAASIKPNEGALARLDAVSDLVACFTPNVSISLAGVPSGAQRVEGISQLRELALAARTHLREANITFSDLYVKVDSGRAMATVRMIGRVQFASPDPPWYQELKVQLRKLDGNWKIARIESVKGLGF